MLTWIKIGESASEIGFGENNLAEVDANGKIVCVVRHGDRLFAIAAKCPHASGRMASGFVDALGHVVCPLHRYRFDPANGRNVSGEGYYIKQWPLELRPDGVYVGFKQGMFGLI